MNKLLKVGAAALLAASTLVGCGSSSDSSEDKTIKVGATAVPHAMILNDVVKDILADEGWTLEVVEFTDYVTPNTSLEEGEIDANYFQTKGYLDDQNESRGLHLVPVAGIHYEPMTIFSKNFTSLDEIEDGATIVIPNDFDNEKRALVVLDAAGLISYDATKVGEDGSPLDGIVTNDKNLQIQEVEAATVPQYNDDADALVVNGNYALEANIKDKANAIFVETPDIEARTNYVVVKEGNEDSEKTKALVDAITSQEVKDYIEENYGSAVICVF
ncbi:MetQ/NlpA family ABC transporter substrate-binding protein [Floccifex sp.]|uniref:MetQ/NlpA family ABC transporter substrate-binding protein n=1 Tax=Floccifex sp. TaxID=2815810 RepID=UPI002A75FC08|nr:MetQ/NlpA family ABC transporter substrate-binding protein [Floccifex sp.]MDD7281606.1 MetQ/NlpA family ABC transporter substrate-binding protein [Erysipelotrichaceae bacterium]MDY2958382.1 MetQ/NlpA family ABC transporter substrate-binding protein [Floccifex sp.]